MPEPSPTLPVDFQVVALTGIDVTDFGSTIRLQPQDAWSLWHFIDGVIDVVDQRTLAGDPPWRRLDMSRCYLTRPRQELSFRVPQGARFRRLVFSVAKDDLRADRESQVLHVDRPQPQPEELFGVDLPCALDPTTSQEAAWVLERGCALWWRGPYNRLRAGHLISGLLLDLIDRQREGQTGADAEPADNWYHRLEQLAREHLSQGLRVSGLAGLAGISVATLQRRLSDARNLSAGAFLDQIRADVSIQLLSAEELDVATISRLVGFRNANSFRRWFGRRFGESPGRWRQVHRRH